MFTGREFLLDLRIYDYRNRMYQPELGRFLQPDPQEFVAGDYNLYRYCHNDPVNKSDPMGLREEIVGDQMKLTITVELQKLRTPTGSNIPQWATVLKGVANGALKAAFTSMVKAAIGGDGKKGDHIDRTQSLYTDKTFSYVARAVWNSHLENGRPQKDDHLTEVIPHDKPLAFLLHFHNDIHGVSSTYPSIGMDDKSVKSNHVPMLFSSESLYKQNEGVLLRPNGNQEPTQTPVLFNW